MMKYRIWGGTAILLFLALLFLLLGAEQLAVSFWKVYVLLVIFLFAGFLIFSYRLLKSSQRKSFGEIHGVAGMSPVAVQVRKNTAQPAGEGVMQNADQSINMTTLDGNVKKMVLEMDCSSRILTDFVVSIKNNMNKYSLPLAEGMYLIKQKVNDFLKNLLEWREELTKEHSAKNFNQIIDRYGSQNVEFKNIFDRVNETYTYLEKNFTDIEVKCNSIYQNTNTIEDVSEKIRVLSINASIEAVRAGESGKGFKIIANEIKKLANMTQSAVDNIDPLIKEARQIVNITLENFMDYVSKITNSINQQKEEFQVFYDTLTNYYNDLNTVFTSASQMIDEINYNINKLTPVFFMTHLSQQGLDNIAKIIENLLLKSDEIRQLAFNSATEEQQKEVLEQVVNYIKSVITTEVEVEVLNNFRKDLKMDEIKLEKKGEADAELF